MKFDVKFHIVALFAAMIALGAQATPVSPAQACSAVSAWAAANGSAFANPGYAVSAVPEYDADGTTVLYYKVAMSDGGLVIASPDTDLDLVVAVLEDASCDFPAGHPLPSILRKDMRNRLSIVRSSASSSGSSSSGSGVSMASMASASTQAASSAELPEDVKESVVKANAQWEKYGNASGMRLLSAGGDEPRSVSTNVFRIVKGFEKGGKFTHWNQSNKNGKPCYNYYTPNNEVCGCVATAGAAIMQFFGNTADAGNTGPVGEDVSCYLYGEKLPDVKTLSGAVDWSVLPKAYGGESESDLDEAGRQLIGRVAYNFGVLVGMSWASEGPGTDSGSYVSRLDDAFKAYGFSAARHVEFNTSDKGASQYFKMVYAQNWAGAPVVLGIHGDTGGHAVVACGYAKTSDDEELCRVFMGWGGSGDAWYKFPQVESYSIIDEAVTMIGYDGTANMDPMDLVSLDEAGANELFNKIGTVPICGWANVTNSKLLFPGVTKSAEGDGGQVSFTLTASVDSNGFFAVRIPVGTTDLRMVHEDSGTEMLVTPFVSKVLKDEEKDRTALEAAMPAELAFLVFNMVTKSTVEHAREKALEDGKAVLMISGAGSIRENLLLDYITCCDAMTDMSNKFVFVRVNSSDVYGDGDPSIGVFDPAEGAADLRWWESNGRLAYENFMDYDSDSDDLVYTFSAENTEALTNSVAYVLNSGYDLYARRHSGIVVEVKALDVEGNALSGIGGVDRPYGTHENCWKNGEEVVMSAPAVCTNENVGIMYECLGWTTNGLAGVGNVVKGCEAVLSLTTSNNVSFAWIWKVKAYRVRASSDPSQEGAVTPSEAWRVPGDRITLVALEKIGSEGLSGWTLDSPSGEYDDVDVPNASLNGTAFSFTVEEPTSVLAKYKGNASPSAPKEYSVSVEVEPSDLEDLMNGGGSLSLGEVNTGYDSYASFAAFSSDVVDSTGGVWRCTGWVQDGETNSVSDLASLDASSQTDVVLVWELQEPETILPVPAEISIKDIVQVDGGWVITVSGAVKDCWYWLYSSEDLSGIVGESGQWTAEVVEKKKAEEDGDVVFAVTSAEGRMFWRARVTATENGDE